MNEYIELLTKIKDTVISPITTGGTFETFKNMVLTGVIVALIACVVVAVSDNLSQVIKFFDFAKVVSILVVFVSTVVAIIMTIGLALHSAVSQIEFYKDTNLAISNYVVEMDEQEYSRLEKLVKLYGNNLSSNDKTIKQINKHLLETIGK